jgi:hypothetical protein
MAVWCAPLNEHPKEKPCIVLLQDPSVNDKWSLQVGVGCEEEGIPLAWGSRPGNAHELARYAALESRLEVGIGLSGSEGAVTFAKYPEEKAYIHQTLKDASYLWWLGQVAARFVKREPIPPLPDRGEDKTASSERPLGDEGSAEMEMEQERLVADLVNQIVKKLYEEVGR